MKIVIQCAASKNPTAGSMIDKSNRRVLFVADPRQAPPSEQCTYARPDDIFDRDVTWREHLADYNRGSRENPLGLFPAYKLYANATYSELVDKFRTENVFILSAGWGLISAEFLTPQYDITFSPMAKGENAYKHRGRKDKYEDFCLLPTASSDDLVFLGGKDYLPLFASLTKSYTGTRHVFFNGVSRPLINGCNLIQFHTSTRTNWHYECAHALVTDAISL